ncbi:MAG: hypothetical protein Q9164_002529 [Protoblastenia rupestris]
MAKKTSPSSRGPKKSAVAKQRDIEKLVANAKKKRAGEKNALGTPTVGPLPAFSQEKRVRMPLAQLSPAPLSPPSIIFQRPRQPKTRSRYPDPLSGGKERGFFLHDRHHGHKALAHLPKEPHVGRAPSFVPKGQFRFLDLPGELRNQVYDYCVPRTHYALKWIDGKKKSGSLTYTLPRYGKASEPRLQADVIENRRLTRKVRDSGRKAVMDDLYRQVNPVSLLWACRQMYPEAASVLYAKSTFSFVLPSTLRHFLNTLTAANKASITSLKIKHQVYGHPAKTEDQRFKAKADRSWNDLCWRISDECSSLSHLGLEMDLNRCPISFGSLDAAMAGGFGTKWMQPLWAFQEIGLKRFWYRLRSAIVAGTVLEVESYNIRKAILDEEWDDNVEAERDAYGYDLNVPRKGGLILCLAGNDLVGTQQGF